MNFSRFDFYPKLNEEFKVKTAGGAIVSLIAIVLIIALFIAELNYFLTIETVDHLYVDVSRGEKVRINFDVTFPSIPCSLLSLDAMDVSGDHQLDVSSHIKKKAIDRDGNTIGGEIKLELKGKDKQKSKDGEVAVADPTKSPNYCGSCYGAEIIPGTCCNTCDSVKEAYRSRGWALPPLTTVEQCLASGETDEHIVKELERGDGCNMYGNLEVNKVAGNFHFAPGKSFQHAHMHIHDLAQYSGHKFNMSHRINSLSFGEPFPGIVNPLDGVAKATKEEENAETGMFMYYVKVVPTRYEYLYGSTVETNQFSVTEHFRPIGGREGQGLPGVFFFYELSPIMVRFTETRQSFFHFLTQLCAILGGVFTVSGMVDIVVYASVRKIAAKQTQGKLI